MTRKDKRRIEALEMEIRRLQPQRTYGMITTKTVRGVSRKPDPMVTGRSTQETTAPRWG